MGIKYLHLGKLSYGLLFCVVLPLLLLWWAVELTIDLPVSSSLKNTGILVTIGGLALITEAMWQLWKNGKGLPMNAFPPTHYVRQGSYKLFYHPIYFGFCMMCAGTSLYFVSPAGVYVVTPVMIILCNALIHGYENLSLKERFGEQEHPTFFGLITDYDARPLLKERIGTWCSVFIPWGIAYQIIIYLGVSPGFINTVLPFEQRWPVIESAELPYALTYFFVGLIPFIVGEKKQLRAFQLNAWWLTGLGIFIQLILPLYAEPRAFTPHSWAGRLILFERSHDGAAAAFPSFHAIWALLAAHAWGNAFPKARWEFRALSLIIILSCIGVGAHAVADVIAAIVLFIIVIYRHSWLSGINQVTERMANSWKEWHLGSFRIINHSIYAGLAAAAGVLFLYQFNIQTSTIVTITFTSIAGGALWGQFVEGSPRLLRPFGFYGALLGGITGVLLCQFILKQSIWINMAAIGMAIPWVQALGRLRCLVQGCCHGSPVTNNYGITYTNSHSRVCQIAGLTGKKLHNTQLYSIGFNVIIGLILLRLWYGGSSSALVMGMYFILSGAARFVEEAYRGEPQTKIIGGLRIYQWMSITSIIAGMVISTAHSSERLLFTPVLNMEALTVTLIAGISWAFAMGMDFPKSNIRFSRLSG